MTWDAWAAVAQLIGALGVIASLIFVGMQVRQSAKATKAAAFQGLVSSVIDVNTASLGNPAIIEIADLARRGEALNPSQHRLYVIFVLTAARVAQSAHYQMQLGLLDKSKLESVVYNLVRHLNTPAGALVWSELAHRSDPEFRGYVGELSGRLDGFDALMSPLDA